MMTMMILFVVAVEFIGAILANVHPITIHGHYFVNSVTKEPTVRIYSVNADLDHDKCMTMLAAAGIYLVLDVNSPLPNHHLNRYEPWSSYNLFYFENIFKVVQSFSTYNNTLGFLAGNEIINDPISAAVAGPFIKAVIRDVKTYINSNAPRPVPVGYSAADDLNYRMPLARYLECANDNPLESVDFYGVNSYQWCGDQTFYSSGYNILVNDYKGYTKPIFFSEYGCNEVLPRNFDEVTVLYTNNMIDVFSGGLVYEFTQEPNNFGLVAIQPNGDVKILRDFLQLQSKFDTLPELDYTFIVQSMKDNARDIQVRIKQFKTPIPKCESTYPNLDISTGVPPSVVDTMIETGVDVRQGSFVKLSSEDLKTDARFYHPSGEVMDIDYEIDVVVDFELDDGQPATDQSTSFPKAKGVERHKESSKRIGAGGGNPGKDRSKDTIGNFHVGSNNTLVNVVHKVTDSVKQWYSNVFNP
ncbi:uncharacterized protein LODBEIA_P49500 [Lodderomyces beijingensis]|uniref:1,3-beta-glucanosyltransferase n=1 Tax=Lodderomyces beijingensis TaxID=1775926 RepID=A0ABP0ZUR8_9ASCO